MPKLGRLRISSISRPLWAAAMPAPRAGRIRSMQPHLWQLLVVTLAGWVNRFQQDAIEYLKEENRVLREQLGGRRLRFTDEQRRRLAAKARALGRDGLKEVAGLVTPDTLLRWYTRLIAKKYDGSKRRGRDGLAWQKRYASSSSGWQPKIQPGAIQGFAALFVTWATTSAETR